LDFATVISYRASSLALRPTPNIEEQVSAFMSPSDKVAQLDPQACHVGFCGGQSGAGVGFLRVLRFPLPNFIPPIAPKIILIYHRGLYSRPKWPQYQGFRYLGTQSHPTNNNNNNIPPLPHTSTWRCA
jgi:hypothetical protein